MTLQSVIKAGEWRRAAARCFCLLLHGDTMLLLSPSGSSWAAPGEAHPCHLPLLLFIRDTLALVAQSGGGVKKKQNTVRSYYFAYPAQLCLISTAQREYIHRVFVFFPRYIHAGRGGIKKCSSPCCFSAGASPCFQLLTLIHCNCLGLREGSCL